MTAELVRQLISAAFDKANQRLPETSRKSFPVPFYVTDRSHRQIWIEYRRPNGDHVFTWNMPGERETPLAWEMRATEWATELGATLVAEQTIDHGDL